MSLSLDRSQKAQIFETVFLVCFILIILLLLKGDYDQPIFFTLILFALYGLTSYWLNQDVTGEDYKKLLLRRVLLVLWLAGFCYTLVGIVQISDNGLNVPYKNGLYPPLTIILGISLIFTLIILLIVRKLKMKKALAQIELQSQPTHNLSNNLVQITKINQQIPSKNQIDTSKNDLKVIKKICPNCGESVSSDLTICPICASELNLK